MGMYNTVTLKEPFPCPHCRGVISEWQTKDMVYAGYDLANVLDELTLNSRMSGEVHGICDACDFYISLDVVKGRIVQSTSTPPRSAVTRL